MGEKMALMSREGTCDYPGCGQEIQAKRLCNRHYRQARKSGNAEPSVKSLPWRDRIRYYTEAGQEEDCWTWRGGHGGKPGARYAVFSRKGASRYAHRSVYEMYYGVPPEGYEVDHQCGNTWCVNPSHLKAVTRGENLQNKGAYRNSKTGVRGVSKTPTGKYVVYAGDGKGGNVYGGCYATLGDAERAAIELRNRLYTNNVRDPKDD